MVQSCSIAVVYPRVPLAEMDTPSRALIIASLALMAAASAACGVGDNKSGMPDKGATGSAGATPASHASAGTAPVLLFNGTGTSPNDVAAVETILRTNHIDYSTANSSQLNEMGEAQIRGYRLLIVPGGNFIDIGNGLASSTTANIRDAVKNGVNYLGICAGGFFAGDSGFNGLNLTSGVRFGFYSAESPPSLKLRRTSQRIRKAAVAIARAGAPTLEHYWEDGPEFTGWGAVVGKYPDGTPAIVEGTFGSGWVLLTGVHPEAPAAWRRGMSFTTPPSEDNAYAGTLIDAALNRTSLSHD
jgi:Biotin-protein ligase, N terminal